MYIIWLSLLAFTLDPVPFGENASPERIFLGSFSALFFFYLHLLFADTFPRPFKCPGTGKIPCLSSPLHGTAILITHSQRVFLSSGTRFFSTAGIISLQEPQFRFWSEFCPISLWPFTTLSHTAKEKIEYSENFFLKIHLKIYLTKNIQNIVLYSSPTTFCYFSFLPCF